MAGVALRDLKMNTGKAVDDKWQDEVHKGVVSAYVLTVLLNLFLVFKFMNILILMWHEFLHFISKLIRIS